ncbi:O-methyltransferase [Conexibacter sp. SYSU D00693]|uniref:O-methyltransferase n=1 Tax=Conexibacter sp. SYSU D00693 TaxID=2812560 RepID=UPI00196A2F64|nr:class I SAM-dependent methyltransferase [Conexibacter sp. SYSU D00693]
MRTLRESAVVEVLARIEAAGAREDGAGKARVRAREAQLGRKVYGRERAELYGTAPIAVAREVGELLHVLVVATGARSVVEFGASVGFSTIHLAAGLRDLGGDGRLVTTELDAAKVALARDHLTASGLADLVDLRAGDALQTLADDPAAVDLLFLDGWNDRYLDVLRLAEPRLRRGALVVADLSRDDPACEAYAAHVLDPASGFTSVRLDVDEGVVLSTRG